MPGENNKYTQEERNLVATFWNQQKSEGKVPSLSEIVSFFTSGRESDPRTVEGRRCRAILSDLQIKAKGAAWDKVEEVILTDDHKTFILNNIKNNRVIDLARELFPERKVAPLGREVRTINKFLDSVGEKVIRKYEEETASDGRYESPRTFHEMLKKINTYTNTELTTQSITAYQKKCIESSINFLHSPRFINEISAYKTVEKRRAFESEFIRLTWDKNDLSADDINIYINLVSDTVVYADIKRQIEKLSQILDDVTDDPEGRIAMSLIEGLGKKETALDQCSKRIKEWYTILTGARSKRVLDRQNSTASLSQLFEWFRDEENRKKMLRQAELQREGRSKEVKRLDTLNDTIFLSLGLQRDEAEF